MELDSITQLVNGAGMGVVSFAFLIYMFYKASKFADTFMNNHMRHLVDSIEELNKKMDKFITLAEKLVSRE